MLWVGEFCTWEASPAQTGHVLPEVGSSFRQAPLRRRLPTPQGHEAGRKVGSRFCARAIPNEAFVLTLMSHTGAQNCIELGDLIWHSLSLCILSECGQMARRGRATSLVCRTPSLLPGCDAAKGSPFLGVLLGRGF